MYLFYGADDFSIKQEINTLQKDFSGVEILSESDQLKNQQTTLGQSNLFGEQPLIVLREMISEVDTDWLDRMEGQTLIFWEGDKIDNRLKTVKWFKEHGAVTHFKEKSRQDVYKWVRDRGYDLDYQLLQTLWERHNANLWAWHNELEKMELYCESKKISPDAVAVLGEKTIEESIFAFLDAFGERKKIVSLSLLDTLLNDNVDPYFLFNMMIRQTRLLLLAEEKDGLRGQPGFVVKKLKSQRRQWDEYELRSTHRHALYIDHLVKTGQADIIDELYGLLLQN